MRWIAVNADPVAGLEGVTRPTPGAHIGRRRTLAHPVGDRAVGIRDIEIDQYVRIFKAKTGYHALNRDIFAFLKGCGERMMRVCG